MTRREIEKRIDQIEDAMWFMEMGEFIDWPKYRQYKDEVQALTAELKRMMEESL